MTLDNRRSIPVSPLRGGWTCRSPFPMFSPRRRSRRLILLISPVLCFLLFYHFLTFPSDQRAPSARDDVPDYRHEFRCPPLPGIEDMLVVLKTGVTEALDKVPVHFQTTLRCVPNYVIFSDFEEKISGVQVHDVLRGVDSEVKRTIPDFDIYNRIQEFGREGLRPVDLRDEANSPTGKPNNPGWKLDKWKFLPMIGEALRFRPNAKWFVFIEADTYVVWPNLVGWLAQLDPTKPDYIGTETQIADVIFAHGGSGFIISNPAMQMVAEHYSAHRDDLHYYTNAHWAGDCVLGKVLRDVGVPLRYSWPMLQNSKLGEVDTLTTNFYRKPWCFPAVAFHHMAPSDIQFMWRFEQQRFQEVCFYLIGKITSTVH